jgi:drug/metabolite transporter (DMT)-like permease
MRDRRGRAILFTVLAGVLWGTSFPVIKVGLNYVDPYMFVFLRFLLASIIMFSVLVVKRTHKFEFEKRRIVWILGLTNGVAYLLQYVGMSYTSAAKSSLLVNLSAIWVAILSSLVLKERLGTRKTIGIVAGILGVLLITTNLNFRTLGQGMVIGDILVFLSGIVWAFFAVYNKRLISNSMEMIQFLTWTLFATMLPLVPFLYFSTTTPLALPIQAWLAIAYTATFCWVIPYYLWLEGLKQISAVSSSIILLTEVIVALAISSTLLNETLTMVSGVGAILVIVAIALVSWGART